MWSVPTPWPPASSPIESKPVRTSPTSQRSWMIPHRTARRRRARDVYRREALRYHQDVLLENAECTPKAGDEISTLSGRSPYRSPQAAIASGVGWTKEWWDALAEDMRHRAEGARDDIDMLPAWALAAGLGDLPAAIGHGANDSDGVFDARLGVKTFGSCCVSERAARRGRSMTDQNQCSGLVSQQIRQAAS